MQPDDVLAARGAGLTWRRRRPFLDGEAGAGPRDRATGAVPDPPALRRVGADAGAVLHLHHERSSASATASDDFPPLEGGG